MYDDFDCQDEYCGFEESDRDAWENEQVFQDTLLERDDWSFDGDDGEPDWDQAEADGFFGSYEE